MKNIIPPTPGGLPIMGPPMLTEPQLSQQHAALHHMGSKLREVIQELYPLYYPLQVVDGFLGGDTAPGSFT